MSSYERERRESEELQGADEEEELQGADEEEATGDGELVQETPLVRSMPPPPMAFEALSVEASPLVTAAASPPVAASAEMPALFPSDTPLPPLPPSALPPLPRAALPATVGRASRPSGEEFLQLTTALELADRARCVPCPSAVPSTDRLRASASHQPETPLMPPAFEAHARVAWPSLAGPSRRSSASSSIG